MSDWQDMAKGTMLEALNIELTEVTEEKVKAVMPVTSDVKQPAGLLHGGASVALAESVASIGSWNLVDQETEFVVGLEINANHIRSKKDGVVTAKAAPLHRGRTTMVWEVQIVDEQERLVCISRCTVAIRKHSEV